MSDIIISITSGGQRDITLSANLAFVFGPVIKHGGEQGNETGWAKVHIDASRDQAATMIEQLQAAIAENHHKMHHVNADNDPAMTEIKASCVWGQGPSDILLVAENAFVKTPADNRNGYIKEGSGWAEADVYITVAQAKTLCAELMGSIQQTDSILAVCAAHDEAFEDGLLEDGEGEHEEPLFTPASNSAETAFGTMHREQN